MREVEIKRFGEITMLDINTIIEGGYVRICSEDEYIDNTIISIDEIKSIYKLSLILGYVFLETSYNKLEYKDGYFEIEYGFGYLKFTKEDFYDFVNYIDREYEYEYEYE